MALLTVETVANGESKSANKRGPSLVGSLGLSCVYKYFCSALAALLSGQYKIYFSSPCSISIPLSPSPSKLGRYVSLDLTKPGQARPFHPLLSQFFNCTSKNLGYTVQYLPQNTYLLTFGIGVAVKMDACLSFSFLLNVFQLR